MRALVTGASGFVGSALCRALSAAGHEVAGLSRDPRAAAERIGAPVEVLLGSVADPREIARAAQGKDVLFHAAGVAALNAPLRVLRWVHVAGTENVIKAARHAHVERVVHMSCADVSLTDEDRMHWDEKRVLPDAPVGPHAQTKLMAEELALAASDDDLEVTALRPALLWGPGDVDGIARITRAARARTPLFYGQGRNLVATTHIDNLTKAALLAAEAEHAPAHAYYITDGEFLEARELYTKLCSSLALPAPAAAPLAPALTRAKLRELFSRDHGAARAELFKHGKSALFDVSQATKDLAYSAAIDFNAALESLADWVKSQGGPDALVARARPVPTEADVEAQVRAAGGD